MLSNRVKSSQFAHESIIFKINEFDPFDTSDRMSSEGKLHALPTGTGKCVDSRGAFVLGCLCVYAARRHISHFGPSAAP